MHSASNRNEYQEYILGGGGKDGWCVRLISLPLSCACCLEILGPQSRGAERACQAGSGIVLAVEPTGQIVHSSLRS